MEINIIFLKRDFDAFLFDWSCTTAFSIFLTELQATSYWTLTALIQVLRLGH